MCNLTIKRSDATNYRTRRTRELYVGYRYKTINKFSGFDKGLGSGVILGIGKLLYNLKKNYCSILNNNMCIEFICSGINIGRQISLMGGKPDCDCNVGRHS